MAEIVGFFANDHLGPVRQIHLPPGPAAGDQLLVNRESAGLERGEFAVLEMDGLARDAHGHRRRVSRLPRDG